MELKTQIQDNKSKQRSGLFPVPTCAPRPLVYSTPSVTKVKRPSISTIHQTPFLPSSTNVTGNSGKTKLCSSAGSPSNSCFISFSKFHCRSDYRVPLWSPLPSVIRLEPCSLIIRNHYQIVSNLDYFIYFLYCTLYIEMTN